MQCYLAKGYMSKSIKQVVIVGGGSAGWLTAGILAAEHQAKLSTGLKITLIESPDVNSIGVGEGTWPTMRNTLQTIGINEKDFIRCCDVAFKQGSQFVGWNDGSVNDKYYHPFVAPHGYGECNLHAYWQNNFASNSFASSLSFQPHLCDAGKAPKQFQTPDYAAVANYGYHLNAKKFADMLKEHCQKNLGVEFICDHVTKVNEDVNGLIKSVSTIKNGNITAELFIDCSGSKAILLGEHYQVPFESKQSILFNDTAIAVQIPYATADAPINSHTVSTATKFGWIWEIGLPTRKGVGHVYSSTHCSDVEAKQVLQNYIKQQLPNLNFDDIQFNKLKFNPGHRALFWHKNCVAVGMAAGFIEPLEASALALVELSAKMISKELPAHQGLLDITAGRFNQRFLYRWQRIIEFLKLHYVLSSRTDSQYWIDNKSPESIPERLTELLTLWQYQIPSYNDFTEIEEIFPSASYQYVLYGMNFNTQLPSTTNQFLNPALATHLNNELKGLTTKYLNGLPSNREFINFINKSN